MTCCINNTNHIPMTSFKYKPGAILRKISLF